MPLTDAELLQSQTTNALYYTHKSDRPFFIETACKLVFKAGFYMSGASVCTDAAGFDALLEQKRAKQAAAEKVFGRPLTI